MVSFMAWILGGTAFGQEPVRVTFKRRYIGRDLLQHADEQERWGDAC